MPPCVFDHEQLVAASRTVGRRELKIIHAPSVRRTPPKVDRLYVKNSTDFSYTVTTVAKRFATDLRLSAPQRLALILDWINDDEDRLPLREVRKLVDRFIKSFDGSKEAGYLRVAVRNDDSLPTWMEDRSGDPQPDPVADKQIAELLRAHRSAKRPRLSMSIKDDSSQPNESDDLSLLRVLVRNLLRRGFPPDDTFEDDDDPDPVGVRRSRDPIPLPSLRFGTERLAPQPSSATKEELRAWERGGAYMSVVTGSRSDLVLFLVNHVLTLPGAVSVGRCPAPAAHNRAKRCGRIFVRSATGRPKRFCDDPGCRVAHARFQERLTRLGLEESEYRRQIADQQAKKFRRQIERHEAMTKQKATTKGKGKRS
jgi:hypothetical protein